LVERLCKEAIDEPCAIAYSAWPVYNNTGPALTNDRKKDPHRAVWRNIATELKCNWLFQNEDGDTVDWGKETIPNVHG
jgi:hypothetical protein